MKLTAALLRVVDELGKFSLPSTRRMDELDERLKAIEKSRTERPTSES